MRRDLQRDRLRRVPSAPRCNGCGQSSPRPYWTIKDIRNIPEFNVAVTVGAPVAAATIVNGESPVISIALTDTSTGSAHRSRHRGRGRRRRRLHSPGRLGRHDCTVPRDGLFRRRQRLRDRPARQRVPVLTTGARAKVTSASAGPWNLSAGVNLGAIVDAACRLSPITMRSPTRGTAPTSGFRRHHRPLRERLLRG